MKHWPSVFCCLLASKWSRLYCNDIFLQIDGETYVPASYCLSFWDKGCNYVWVSLKQSSQQFFWFPENIGIGWKRRLQSIDFISTFFSSGKEWFSMNWLSLMFSAELDWSNFKHWSIWSPIFCDLTVNFFKFFARINGAVFDQYSLPPHTLQCFDLPTKPRDIIRVELHPGSATAFTLCTRILESFLSNNKALIRWFKRIMRIF